jgi:hypothetical protein
MADGFDVFISYRRDGGSHWAAGVKLLLAQNGISSALDVDEHEAGKDFLRQIRRNIEASSVFLLLLTEGSAQRLANPGDVCTFEIASALELGRTIIPVADTKAAFPDDALKAALPIRVSEVFKLHALLWEHHRLRASQQDLIEALTAPSKVARLKASSECAAIDTATRDVAYQRWQTDFLHHLYAPDAAKLGLDREGLFFPRLRGHAYPVVCFESGLGGEPFVHGQLKPKLERREMRQLPNLTLHPDAPIPPWVAASPLRQRYFELLAYARRVRRWNMPGYALSALRLDAQGRVDGFDARLCTYGENCLTSHVLGFDLQRSWIEDKRGRLQLQRPGLEAVLNPSGDDFLPLISVQAIVAYRDPDVGEWKAITMMRSDTVAAAAGFWQFPPAGGFEIFGREDDKGEYLRAQFDVRRALLREFLEEIYGDEEMACEVVGKGGRHQDGTDGYMGIRAAIDAGQMSIHFLGVVTELVSLRPEFSFLIVLNDLRHFQALKYEHTLPNGEKKLASWLNASGEETTRLNDSSLEDLDGLLDDDKQWHSSSIGMLLLLARAARAGDGWLRRRYQDFPSLGAL